MSLTDKLKSDAGAAERAARRKQAELKRKVRQDLKTAQRKARNVDADSIRAAASQQRPAEADPREVESDGDGIGERAYRAGQAPSVVDASIDPAPSGPGMQMFASRTGNMDEGFIGGRRRGRPEQSRDSPPANERQQRDEGIGDGGFGFFEGMEGGDDGESESALAFDDPLGVGGGWF